MRHRLIEAELVVEIAVADRLEIVDAADRHAALDPRVRHRRRREMPAGGPSGHRDPVRIAAKRGQLLGEIIEPAINFGAIGPSANSEKASLARICQ